MDRSPDYWRLDRMRTQFFSKALSLGTAATAAAVMAIVVPIAGQTSKRPVPRTAWGVPDLQGFYNVATITPLERPANFGNRLALTEAEASALERAEAQRDQKLDEKSAPVEQRAAPAVGGDKANPNATYLERLFEGGGGTVG